MIRARVRLPHAVLMASCVALALTVAAPRADAATFVVNTTTDPVVDGCTQDECSLREAIIAANAAPGPDTITLPAGNYQVALVGSGDDTGQVGDLDITDQVRILGAGTGATVLEIPGTEDRVVDVHESATGVVFSDLTVQGGFLPNGTSTTGGAGIRNRGGLRLIDVTVASNEIGQGCCGGGIANSGTLTLVNSMVTLNFTPSSGGAIYNDGGTLTLRNSIVHHNEADSFAAGIANVNGGAVALFDSRVARNEGGSGAGIFSSNVGSSVKLTRSILTGNSAACCGGAINNVDGSEFTITGSIIEHNFSRGGCCGGGIANDDPNSIMTITRSAINNNVARGCCGGGIANSGQLTIADSSVSFNSMLNSCCGGGISNGGRLIMKRTLVKGNDAESGGGLSNHVGAKSIISESAFVDNAALQTGGAIENVGAATLRMTNSTLHGNAASSGGGVVFTGGNLSEGSVTLVHVTVTNNTSAEGADGLVNDTTRPFTIKRSIIAGNGDVNCGAGITGSGVNLDDDSTCFSGSSALHADPKLAPLSNNGGRTPTRALKAASPAVDAAPKAACPPPAIDQRGVARPQDGDSNGSARCDLGAYERKG